MILTPNDLPRAQAIAQALLLQAVNDEHGRDEGDKFYKVVTENRDGPTPIQRAKYSSCADLAHWFLRSLGVRADWLNRNDDEDGKPWKSGVNLNWLCARPIGKCPLATKQLGGEPAPGDVFVENNVYGGHVFCAVDYVAKTDTLITAEYGQPGGKLKARPLFKLSFNKRSLGHLRLSDVGACTAPVDFSALQDRMTGEELDALEGLIPFVP
jgi:hypothetical protein